MPEVQFLEGSYAGSVPEARLWRWLEQAAQESARVRLQEAGFDLFDRWLDLYHGAHYDSNLPSYKPPIVVNELRTLIISEASDLSDSGFRVYVMKDPRKGGRDEEYERALRALWVREQIDLRVMEAAVWAEVCGTGFLRIGWDPDRYYGMGDVTVEAIDPRCILPDPDAETERGMQFVIYETILDLSDIRRLFPRRGEAVKPEDSYSSKEGGYVSSNLTPGTPYQGPLVEGDSLLGRQTPGYKKARARVLDAFVRDDTLETVTIPLTDPTGLPMKDDNGNPILQQTRRMKYPGGRRIVGANGVILYDGPNTNPGGDFGLVRVVLEPTMGAFWGSGFVQQTGEIQLAANKLASLVVENGIRLNNGIVVAKGNTGIDWETFAGIPGQIVQIAQGGDFDIKYPPAMPAEMVNAPVQWLDIQRRVLGFTEPRMGAGGKGNTSPEVTETDISQAQGTTRLRAKYLYHTVQRMAEMIFARMASGYTLERTIPAVEGESFKPITWRPIEQPERYAVYVDPASFQVMSKSMLRRMSIVLYKMGAIDRKALLEAIGWPDWEQVAGRIDQAEKMAAMAKMQSKKS